MIVAVLDYVELPVGSAPEACTFYGDAFGWSFTAYGEDYAAHEGGPCQLGIDGTKDAKKTPAILPVIRVEDLEAVQSSVISAGGTIVQEIFAFPGGRRFHFRDPQGNVLGVYQVED